MALEDLGLQVYPFLAYAKLYEKVLIVFYGGLIIRKDYRDLDELSQLGLVFSFTTSDGKAFDMKVPPLDR